MIGIDIVDIERVKKIYQRHKRLFLEKILDTREIVELNKARGENFFKRLGCYIACKEAVFKACSEENFDWKEISIRSISHSPRISIIRPQFNQQIHLSLSVDGDIAIAQAIA